MRRHIDWKTLLPLMVVGLIGLQLGVWLQHAIADLEKTSVRQIVGGIQLATLLAFLLLKVEPQDRVHVLWGIAALLLGGVIAGCAGMGGPFIVLWVAAHRWSNFKMRASILVLIASMIPFQIGFLTQFISHRLAGENLAGSTVTARARIMVQT